MLRTKIRKFSDSVVFGLVKAWNEFVDPGASLDPGVLTDNTTGAVDGTLADVGGAFNQATLNANFADLAAKYNALRRLFFNKHAAVTTKSAATDYENPGDTADTITSTNASDLPTVIILANEAKSVINRHFADTLAHNTAVSAAISTAAATDQTTANALLNAIKAAYNTHRSAASVHFENDTGNAVSSADATDLSSSITLANEIKTDFNAHVVLAPMGARIEIVAA